MAGGGGQTITLEYIQKKSKNVINIWPRTLMLLLVWKHPQVVMINCIHHDPQENCGAQGRMINFILHTEKKSKNFSFKSV